MKINPSPDTLKFLETRRSVTARMMDNMPPSDEEVERILRIGTRVPDHGKQCPWRLVVLAGGQRLKFGEEVLAPRFGALHPESAETTIALEAKRFERAGVVIAVVSKPTHHPKIPVWEMELSTGAVCAHLLIAAQAMGYAAQWLTEWPASDDVVLAALGGEPGKDRIAGFIYIGHATEAPSERDRPALEEVTSYFGS